ncbi:MAG: ATP-binding cassette domain-containing protein [Deltaproteobacteria bacterium]|nr:ATP-binding cassette domain-containing protein [Deltaproteobacteria bacterium]
MVELAKKSSLSTPSVAVEFSSISLNFGPRQVLGSLSFAVEAGSKVSLLGESSCGKSTILKLIAGLITPQSGKIFIFGQNLAELSRSDMEKFRRSLGFQFQAGAMFDSMTVEENLLIASREGRRGRSLPALGRDEIAELLDKVGLAKAMKLKPSALSGGMRKRAALARALIARPSLALFDEPTAGLDPITSCLIIDLLNSLSGKEQAAMILASSDIDVARRFSDDILLIGSGRLIKRGSLKDMLESSDKYVERYFRRFKMAYPQTQALDLSGPTMTTADAT